MSLGDVTVVAGGLEARAAPLGDVAVDVVESGSWLAESCLGSFPFPCRLNLDGSILRRKDLSFTFSSTLAVDS